MKLGIFSDQIEKANTKFDAADETKKCLPLFQKKKRERENKYFISKRQPKTPDCLSRTLKHLPCCSGIWIFQKEFF